MNWKCRLIGHDDVHHSDRFTFGDELMTWVNYHFWNQCRRCGRETAKTIACEPNPQANGAYRDVQWKVSMH